jgi:hypothetical protein
MKKMTKKEVAKVEEKTQAMPTVTGNNPLTAMMSVAEELSKSDIIPKEFQKKPANCLIAVQLANRLKADPFMVMQNTDVIYGKPALRSTFIIACINGSGKLLGNLKFELNEKCTKCRAWGIEKETGAKLYGPTITMEMAQAEGWVAKNGSKWKTMPEIMLRYRAASFFGRLQCPEILNGIYSTEEVEEMAVSIPTQEIVDVFADDDVTDVDPENATTEKTGNSGEMEITPEMEEKANSYFEEQENENG